MTLWYLIFPIDDVMEACLIQREMGISDKFAGTDIINSFQSVITERAPYVSLANTFKILGSEGAGWSSWGKDRMER